jgi:uncharacterized protein
MHYRSSKPEYNMNIKGFHTSEHLRNARIQADQRGLDDVLIVDVDSHHYETDDLSEILDTSMTRRSSTWRSIPMPTRGLMRC